MQKQRCPICGRTGCDHSRFQQYADAMRELDSCTCVICRGSLADHETRDHASRVIDRFAAIGFPMPANVGIP